jgi:hypothetical protein
MRRLRSKLDQFRYGRQLARHFDCRPKIANRLLHLSRRHRLMYLAVPKAACSTILSVLQWHEVGGNDQLVPPDPHDMESSPLVAPFTDMALFDTAMKSDEFLRFSFVRDPYARALSGYLEKCCGREGARRIYLPKLGYRPDAFITFRRFLEIVREQRPSQMDVHWAPQTYLLSLGRVAYDFLGRVERLETDLASVLARRGMSLPDTRRNTRWHATGARGRLHQSYGAQEIKLVREIYAEDFEALGYDRDLVTRPAGRQRGRLTSAVRIRAASERLRFRA